MLFEGRNKAYGAYKLRSETGRRYGVVLLVLLFLFVVMMAAGFIYVSVAKGGSRRVARVDRVVKFEGIRLLEMEPQQKKGGEEEEQEVEEELPRDEGNDATDVTNAEPETEETQLMAEATDSVIAEPRDTTMALAQSHGVRVDSIAQYPGGIRNLMRWLEKTMVYPQQCIDGRLEGSVEVAFIVEADGSLSNIRLLSSTDSLMGDEVLRVMQKMQNWLPARSRGVNVRSQVTLPVVFSLSDFSMK